MSHVAKFKNICENKAAKAKKNGKFEEKQKKLELTFGSFRFIKITCDRIFPHFLFCCFLLLLVYPEIDFALILTKLVYWGNQSRDFDNSFIFRMKQHPYDVTIHFNDIEHLVKNHLLFSNSNSLLVRFCPTFFLCVHCLKEQSFQI